MRLGDNALTGTIPESLGKLVNLVNLGLASCGLTGSIPSQLGQLSLLENLILQDNELMGPIPTELGNCSSLTIFTAANNKLNGSIPSELSRLRNLQILNFANNSLSGEIPSQLGDMRIPEELGNMDLSYNNLSGHIPPSLGTLSKLEAFDLSHNQLTGEIPPEVGEMSSLGKLDLSYNSLQGKLDKQFSRWPGEAFEGNQHLCGSPLERCQRDDASGSAGLNEWEDIMDATNNLSDDFMIGSGGSGKIYKAELATGETVAVKKISTKDEFLLNKSFIREVKTLGRIRHRHLVKLIGYCTNRNKEACWNLLIYEYMENGSVWDWLHGKPAKASKVKRSLDWETRLKIAVGLAQGVEYLHHDCVPKIIHRDIKSSNVLLDSKMEAHLGDFGLAKALNENYDSNTESNSWFAGSYGYIAPEYAFSLHATEKSDVYSMGIVLMELVSGKMPTNEIFGAEMDMVRWVEMYINMHGSAREELVDPELKPLLPGEEFAVFQVLEIALQCTKTTPQQRPSSRKVCDLLLHVFNNGMVDFEKLNLNHYK
uniref:non-specific serine/threonine protein kinase n=1 Tax=Cajanus cajan TaxID=3821 RepID=A0A151QUZ5_CAJCA|nr:LRR receptor-like serine/threonine-protein kinase GSO1 [Cajanus cajan]